ncbi:MAG: PspC domain-containing protein, partial [Prevotella sp.]|nr:PspC domain-containing protein [Prevotella sp.]
MKKNITINLCGRLYNIDEDAYDLLRNYIDSLRSYFGKQQGGEEIADDIEERIAELLDELKERDIEAITIDHVQDIIKRVGNPDEMDTPHDTDESDDKTTENRQEQHSLFSKRLYRNPNDKKLTGVLSGIAAYLNVDSLWCRLVFVGIMMFFWLTGLRQVFWMLTLVYIVMAVLMPVAGTPEERLRMKGHRVTPETLRKEVTEEADRQYETRRSEGNRSLISSFFSTIFTMIGFLFRWFVYALGFLMVLVCVACVVALASVFIAPETSLNHSVYMSELFQTALPTLRPAFIVLAVSSFIVLLITAYSIIHSLLSEFKQLPVMSYAQRVVLLIIWVVAVIVSLVAGTILIPRIIKIEHKLEEKRVVESRLEDTHDGIYIEKEEWDFLNENGWRILNAEGCNDRFTAYGEYYVSGSEGNRYLDCYDKHHRQRYRAERTDSIMPGTYRLSVAARADGRGVYVYMITNGKKRLIEIPANGNTGGDIWESAKDKLDNLESKGKDVDEETRCLADVNDSNGYGWSRLVFDSIVVKTPTTISYGLCSDPSFTWKSWIGHWFSACDFVLEEVGTG